MSVVVRAAVSTAASVASATSHSGTTSGNGASSVSNTFHGGFEPIVKVLTPLDYVFFALAALYFLLVVFPFVQLVRLRTHSQLPLMHWTTQKLFLALLLIVDTGAANAGARDAHTHIHTRSFARSTHKHTHAHTHTHTFSKHARSRSPFRLFHHSLAACFCCLPCSSTPRRLLSFFIKIFRLPT